MIGDGIVNYPGPDQKIATLLNQAQGVNDLSLQDVEFGAGVNFLKQLGQQYFQDQQVHLKRRSESWLSGQVKYWTGKEGTAAKIGKAVTAKVFAFNDGIFADVLTRQGVHKLGKFIFNNDVNPNVKKTWGQWAKGLFSKTVQMTAEEQFIRDYGKPIAAMITTLSPFAVGMGITAVGFLFGYVCSKVRGNDVIKYPDAETFMKSCPSIDELTARMSPNEINELKKILVRIDFYSRIDQLFPDEDSRQVRSENIQKLISCYTMGPSDKPYFLDGKPITERERDIIDSFSRLMNTSHMLDTATAKQTTDQFINMIVDHTYDFSPDDKGRVALRDESGRLTGRFMHLSGEVEIDPSEFKEQIVHVIEIIEVEDEPPVRNLLMNRAHNQNDIFIQEVNDALRESRVVIEDL